MNLGWIVTGVVRVEGDGVHLYAFGEPAQEIRWRCLMYGWMMVPRLVLCIALAANVYWAQEWRVSRIVSMHYPCLALISKIEGSVTLQVTIGEAGKPVEVKALRGHPLLLGGAAENIKKWAFRRTVKNRHLPSTFEMTYLFQIRGTRKAKEEDVDVVVELPRTVVVTSGFDPKLPCEIPPLE